MREFYVYEWFIVGTNEVFYVGKGKNNRYKQLKKNKFFMDMYNAHECDVRIICDNLTENEAFEKEKEIIAYYRNNTEYRLTNVTDGGEGVSGWIPSDELKQRQSVISKERWQNDEFKERMIAIRNDENSVYQSKEFRNKISQIVQGTNNPNYGNTWNEEQRKHLSKIRKEMGLAKGINNPTATSIICLETGEVFNLISEAQEQYGVKTISSFSIALKNRQKTAGNMHWLKFEERLLNEDIRFYELLISLSESQKFPIVCVQTRKIYNNRKIFLQDKNIGIKKFLKEYSEKQKITINNEEYMYVNDYLSRFTQRCV